MQNSTFRRKGINWFLFAFILFVGNLSAAYAQNCPTLDSGDESQSFCYLSRVSDLQANANGDGVQWYRTATSSTPIPSDEILQTGSYFAGNDSGDCNARQEVIVTIDDLGPPTTTFGNFYEPCEYSSSDVTTVGELKSLIVPSDGTYDINVYGQDDEFGTNELTDATVLVEGNSYFIGQDDPSSSCEYSSRIAIQYNPILATAPTAEATQTFCEGATVADLEAQGINRWYSTETSNPNLAPSTPLVDGATYYASRIVNRTNSSLPPCESQDRTAVTVTLTETSAGADNVGFVCEGDVDATLSNDQEVREYYLSLLEPDVPQDGNFSPTIDEIIDQYQSDTDGLGDFTVTYTIGSGSCADSVELTIRIIEEAPAEAGDFDDISDICVDGSVIDLTTLTNNDASATSGGTFSGTGVTSNQFDPSVGEGVYEITYTVDENSAPCTIGTDSTTFTITVNEADAGSDITETICSSEIEDPTALAAEFASYLEGRDTDGTFSPSLTNVYLEYQNDLSSGNLPQTYNVVYTVTDGTCSDQASIALTINPSPDAGEDGTANLSSNDDPVNLIDYLGGTPDSGGTWNTGDGTFDPATDIPGTFTYTVTNSFDCQDSSTVTVSVDDECAGFTAGNDNVGEVCETDVETTLSNLDEVREYYLDLLDDGVPTDGTFDPTIEELSNQYQDDLANDDGLGDFTTTYTITDGSCTDSAELTIRITPTVPANAGDDVNLSFCTSDDDQNLYSYIPEGANTDGVFDGYEDGMFSPSTEGEGTYTITYNVDASTACVTGSASATYTLVVNEGDADAGEDNIIELLSTDDPINLFDALGGTPDEGGTWSPGDGTFDPSTDIPGVFTYTVLDGDCTDSATVTVEVTTDDECAGFTAGNDNVGEVCETDVETTLSNLDEVREYYLDLLDDGVPTDGTFDPTIEEVSNQYQDDLANDDGLGDFTTTYTITDGTCTDSAELTIRITPTVPANAGDDVNLSFCTSDDDQNLYSYIPEGANTDGVFDGYEDGMFSPSTEGEGTYTITYNVDASTACVTGSASATYTLVVNEGDADAGEDNTIELLSTDDPINLFDALGGTPDEGGTWSPGDGTFDPSTDIPGVFTYTVLDGDCTDSATVTVEVTTDDECAGFTAGNDNVGEVCETDVETTLSNLDEVREYYLDLLDDGVPTDGTFDPTIEEVSNQYQDDLANDDGLGDFTTTYTITDGTCTDSAELTIRIIPIETADAGDDVNLSFCNSGGDESLYDYLSESAISTGIFEGYEDGIFSPSGEAVGTYTITYTVDASSSCVTGTDSAIFTIEVFEGSANAGENNTSEVCELDVDELFPNAQRVRDYYLSLLDEGVATDGTFNPSIQDIINTYQSDEDGVGDFTTIYTVTDDLCEDSVELTISVLPADEIILTEITDQELCLNDDPVNLFDYLAEGTLETGSFDGYADGIFDPSVEGEGSFDVTYAVRGEDCSQGQTSFTITVTDSAFAGDDMEFDVCMNAGAQDLYSFLAADADMDGEFTLDGEIITDGTMDPSAFEAGEYEVLYNVASINDCGDDTATFTITVVEAADAPELNDITFCAIQSPTGANLIAENADLTFYSDADLTMMVTAEEELVAGTYYATSNNDGECESEAAEFTVSINDPGTPTIDDVNPTFCEYDDATIGDLNDAVDQTSNVTWYSSEDSTEALSTGTALQDGATYYASLYDPETDCDSSSRLAVTVTIEECPLLYPEGISPNGDGLNDTFDIENIEREYPNYTIQIYNRWGKVVYKGNASTPEWDGTATESGALGDDVLPVGVYFYLLDFNDGVTTPRRGKVYLSR